MVHRLVVGSGPLVRPLADALGPSGSFSVATADDHLTTTLRDDGVTVHAIEPTDPEALSRLDADIVFVVDRERALAVTRATRSAFPEAYLLSCAGLKDDTTALAALADRAIDPGTALASYVLDRVGDRGRRMRQLWTILRGIDQLAVLTHDNPDPDAIASGVALARIAEAAGCEAQVCYYGEITHQENRAFVNVLELDLYNLDRDEELEAFDGLALVDHSRPGVNDQLPEETAVDIVIDHHPPRTPVDARFVDLRSGVGATSTLLVDYLERSGIGFDRTVATALLFGIHVDTNAFRRGVSPADFEATAALVEAVDFDVLERIESPSVSASTLETVASAIRNRRIEGAVLLSYVGPLSERDALAQAADQLLALEDVTATVVYGISGGTIFVSARARGGAVDIGEAIRDAFDPIGSAGGHANMAGAQVELGILDAVDEHAESLQEIIEHVVADRFLEAIDANTARPLTGLYDDVEDPYLVEELLETVADREGAPDQSDEADEDSERGERPG